jgi:hypothetical protein
LMTAQLRYLGDSADLLDAAVSAILLVLYVGALALSTATVRSEPVRSS